MEGEITDLVQNTIKYDCPYQFLSIDTSQLVVHLWLIFKAMKLFCQFFLAFWGRGSTSLLSWPCIKITPSDHSILTNRSTHYPSHLQNPMDLMFVIRKNSCLNLIPKDLVFAGKEVIRS